MACRSPFSRSRLRWRGLRRQTDPTAQFSIDAAAHPPTTATRPPPDGIQSIPHREGSLCGTPRDRSRRLALHREQDRALTLAASVEPDQPELLPETQLGQQRDVARLPKAQLSNKETSPASLHPSSRNAGDNSILRVGTPKISVVSCVDQKIQLFCSPPLSTSSSPLATAATGTAGP